MLPISQRTAQPTCFPLAVVSQKRAVSGNVALKSSAGMPQLLCFSDSHFLIQKWPGCLRSSQLAFLSVMVTASAADLHPCLASLLNYSSISSRLILCSIPKKMSKAPLYHLVYFLSEHQAEPYKVHLTVFRIFLPLLLCAFLLLASLTLTDIRPANIE